VLLPLHVHERGRQQLKQRRLLLDDVEAMRLLTLILVVIVLSACALGANCTFQSGLSCADCWLQACAARRTVPANGYE
jgi:hypothetical protein